MKNLIAITEVRYAGKTHVPGTKTAEFEASDKDAKILKAIKKAADAPRRLVEAPSVSHTPGSASVPSVPEPEPVAIETIDEASFDSTHEEVSRNRGRRYNRRDMRAQE